MQANFTQILLKTKTNLGAEKRTYISRIFCYFSSFFQCHILQCHWIISHEKTNPSSTVYSWRNWFIWCFKVKICLGGVDCHFATHTERVKIVTLRNLEQIFFGSTGCLFWKSTFFWKIVVYLQLDIFGQKWIDHFRYQLLNCLIYICMMSRRSNYTIFIIGILFFYDVNCIFFLPKGTWKPI